MMKSDAKSPVLYDYNGLNQAVHPPSLPSLCTQELLSVGPTTSMRALTPATLVINHPFPLYLQPRGPPTSSSPVPPFPTTRTITVTSTARRTASGPHRCRLHRYVQSRPDLRRRRLSHPHRETTPHHPHRSLPRRLPCLHPLYPRHKHRHEPRPYGLLADQRHPRAPSTRCDSFIRLGANRSRTHIGPIGREVGR